MRNPLSAETIQAIADAGFDVYQRQSPDTYAYFTDGQNLGYIQYGPLEGLTLSSVHVANRTSGTGYGFGELKALDKKALSRAFELAPSWADDKSRASVRKYTNLAAFLKDNAWGGGLKLVAEGKK